MARHGTDFDAQDLAGDWCARCRPDESQHRGAGTGEAWAVRDMDMMGDGIYKSTDAGETWTHMGLPETGRIGTIAIHPANPEIVLVCALGRATGPQKERGVYRTEDGGKTWQQVLFVDENTGCSGVQISQQNPQVVLAGTWEIELQTHVLHSGGMAADPSFERWWQDSRSHPPWTAPPPYGKTDSDRAADGLGCTRSSIPRRRSQGPKSQAQARCGDPPCGRHLEQRDLGPAADRPRGYYIRIRVSPDDPDHVLSPTARCGAHAMAADLGERRRRVRRLSRHLVGSHPAMAGHYIVTGTAAWAFTVHR